MNNLLKMGALTVALGLGLHAADSSATVATSATYSNAVNYCQAFTPGPSNTIRNRVIGAENIGATIAVACNFHTTTNGSATAGQTNLNYVRVLFTNNSTAATTVSCTLLTGTSAGVTTGFTGYAVTKTTTSFAPGAANSVTFTPADNPTAGAVDLGNILVGVNCTLPTNVILSATVLRQSLDNGVGN